MNREGKLSDYNHVMDYYSFCQKNKAVLSSPLPTSSMFTIIIKNKVTGKNVIVTPGVQEIVSEFWYKEIDSQLTFSPTVATMAPYFSNSLCDK